MRLSHTFKLTILACFMSLAPSVWAGPVYKVAVDDIIHRVTAGYIIDGIEKAEAEGGELVLIKLETPGGLDISMREIIEKILNSEVPVAVYVAPSGARAASAGFLITIGVSLITKPPPGAAAEMDAVRSEVGPVFRRR